MKAIDPRTWAWKRRFIKASRSLYKANKSFGVEQTYKEARRDHFDFQMKMGFESVICVCRVWLK